jgi:thymidine kinase
MLTVITGPMFAGKTSSLISRCTSHIIAGDKVIAFKPAKDNRYDEKYIVSHNLDKFNCVVIQKAGDMWEHLKDDKPRYDIIAIDEVQFLDANSIVDFVTIMQNTLVKRIIVAGLAQDARGHPFGAMPELLSMADEIVHLKAVCSSCKGIGAATRTYMKDKGRINEQVVVGGAEKYEARCFTCWRHS